MSAVAGLCGVRCSLHTIAVQPRLPRHWTSVTLPLSYLGQRLQLEISAERVKVRALSPLDLPLGILVGGVRHALPRTGELVVAITAATSRSVNDRN
jgi:trehalose/maltose hydrolase-like predicted phosphorylase